MELLKILVICLFVTMTLLECAPLAMTKSSNDCQRLCEFVTDVVQNINLVLTNILRKEKTYKDAWKMTKTIGCNIDAFKSCYKYQHTVASIATNIFEILPILKQNLNFLMSYVPADNNLAIMYIESCNPHVKKSFSASYILSNSTCCNNTDIMYFSTYKQIERSLFGAKISIVEDNMAQKCFEKLRALIL